MKAKVLKEFKDKVSGKIHKKDEVIYVTKARYEEILKVGPLVEEVKEPKNEKAPQNK